MNSSEMIVSTSASSMSHHGFFQLIAALNGLSDTWLMSAINDARDRSAKFDLPTDSMCNIITMRAFLFTLVLMSD